VAECRLAGFSALSHPCISIYLPLHLHTSPLYLPRLAGFTALQLKEGCGLNVVELMNGGFGPSDLVAADFPVPELINFCEYLPSELHAAGASAPRSSLPLTSSLSLSLSLSLTLTLALTLAPTLPLPRAQPAGGGREHAGAAQGRGVHRGGGQGHGRLHTAADGGGRLPSRRCGAAARRRLH